MLYVTFEELHLFLLEDFLLPPHHRFLCSALIGVSTSVLKCKTITLSPEKMIIHLHAAPVPGYRGLEFGATKLAPGLELLNTDMKLPSNLIISQPWETFVWFACSWCGGGGLTKLTSSGLQPINSIARHRPGSPRLGSPRNHPQKWKYFPCMWIRVHLKIEMKSHISSPPGLLKDGNGKYIICINRSTHTWSGEIFHFIRRRFSFVDVQVSLQYPIYIFILEHERVQTS